MNTVFTILTILIIVAAVLLILVVLLQNGKGDGMASNFVAGNQTFGVRQTADILEKVTWGLVAFILVASIVSAFTLRSGGSNVDITDKIEQTAQPAQPEFPVQPIQQAAPANAEAAAAAEEAPAAAETPAAEETPAK